MPEIYSLLVPGEVQNQCYWTEIKMLGGAALSLEVLGINSCQEVLLLELPALPDLWLCYSVLQG